MLNRTKKLDAVSTKSTAAVFSPQSALCPLCFYLAIPNHILGPYYACFGHVMGIGACKMSLAMFYAFWNNHNNMQGYECKTCSSITPFVLENVTGAKGRLGKKITAVLLNWLHSISLANLTFSFCRHSRAWNSQSCQHQLPCQIWSNFKHLSRAWPLMGYGNSEKTSGPETLSPTLIATYGENDSLKT